MSRLVGSILPRPLLERLHGNDLAERLGTAVLILTSDTAGWPHPAMLSYGEMIAVDPRRIRFALHRTSATAENLRRTRRMTLCFVETGMAYYVKATVGAPQDPMSGFPQLARFEATVQTVLADEARADSEPGAAILTGVRFAPGRPAVAVLCDWQAVMEGLRRDA